MCRHFALTLVNVAQDSQEVILNIFLTALLVVITAHPRAGCLLGH